MRISDWSSDVCNSGSSGKFRFSLYSYEAVYDVCTKTDAKAGCTVFRRRLGGLQRDGRWRAHPPPVVRSEEHTSELQSLMRISYAVFCLKKKHKEHSHSKTTKAKERDNTK